MIQRPKESCHGNVVFLMVVKTDGQYPVLRPWYGRAHSPMGIGHGAPALLQRLWRMQRNVGCVCCRNLLSRHLEEFITIGVTNDTVPPARSRVVSKWRSALTGERWAWENKAGERRWSLEMLKFECVEPRARQQRSRVPQCTGLGVCWEGQETDYPSCFLWLVQMWWMAGRWAKETWHEGRSWQRPLCRGCRNQSCRSRLTLLCAKGTREKASAANPGGCL